jgi:hypothetical protein
MSAREPLVAVSQGTRTLVSVEPRSEVRRIVPFRFQVVAQDDYPETTKDSQIYVRIDVRNCSGIETVETDDYSSHMIFHLDNEKSH